MHGTVSERQNSNSLEKRSRSLKVPGIALMYSLLRHGTETQAQQ
jgi:hypothetical protein